jgi:TolB-like protein/DNA-binding winged helix-turn-helix (wHTH) protein
MEPESNGLKAYRFGAFEAHITTGELRKDGTKLRLQEQPFQVLALLLEQAGELVPRDEIKNRLWAQDTFVDFDHGLNIAINKIREALGDRAENPRFIQTLPKRGYRFIAPVTSITNSNLPTLELVPNHETAVKGGVSNMARALRYGLAALAGMAVLSGALVAMNALGWPDRRFRPDRPQIESIAVLPFENLSAEVGQEYFADAMTDQVITTLGSMHLLRVVSRASVVQYKRTHQSLPEIARELKMDAIVEGTVFRSGNQIHVTAKLLDAPADRHLWAGTFDWDLPDTLSLQRHVAHEVMNGIRLQLFPPPVLARPVPSGH